MQSVVNEASWLLSRWWWWYVTLLFVFMWNGREPPSCLSFDQHRRLPTSGPMHRQGSWSASAAGTTPVYSYWNAYFGGVGSQPAICSGIVILGSLNQNIYAFNATTGASVWTFPAGAMASYSAPACSVDEQVVFSTTTNNVLFAIQVSTGRALWNVSVPSSTYVAPLVVGDLVYLYVLALNANTSAVVWSHAEASGSSGQGLAVVDGVAYYGSGGGVVRSLNALSGAVGWSYNIGSSGDMSTPSVANGLVFIGSQDNSIYAIDASTGSLAWSHATEAGSCPLRPLSTALSTLEATTITSTRWRPLPVSSFGALIRKPPSCTEWWWRTIYFTVAAAISRRWTSTTAMCSGHL